MFYEWKNSFLVSDYYFTKSDSYTDESPYTGVSLLVSDSVPILISSITVHITLSNIKTRYIPTETILPNELTSIILLTISSSLNVTTFSFS